MINTEKETNAGIFKVFFDAVRSEPQITATGLDILLAECLHHAQGDLKDFFNAYQQQVQEDMKTPRGIQQYTQSGVLEKLKEIKSRYL